MKRTRKHIKLSLWLCLALTMAFMGCKDNSDFRKVRNEALTNLQRGGMIQFEDVRARLLSKGDDPNTGRLSIEVIDPNNNAVDYTVYAVTPTDSVKIGASLTSFPAVLEIDFAEVSAALGGNLNIAESYRIVGEVTTEDGTVWNTKALNITTENGVTTVEGNTRFEVFQPANEGLKQALLFDVVSVCSTPPAISDFTGTWEVASHRRSGRARNLNGDMVNIVPGPGTNQITLQNLWGDGIDFVVDVDAESDGDISSERQESYFDGGRNTNIFSQIEFSRDEEAPRAYLCDDLLVLRFFHTREDTNGALSTIRSRIRLRKQ